LNETYEKFKKRGLVVVGVTNEPEAMVKSYIEANGVQYPIAIEKSFSSFNKLGVSGFPHAFLIDTKGKIVWEGHPGQLANSNLEKVLAGARPPVIPEPLRPAQKSLDKEEFGKALEILKKIVAETKMSDEHKAAADLMIASIESDAKSLYETSIAQLEKKEYFEALAGLERVGINYGGVYKTDEALTKAKEIRADAALKPELDAGARLAEGRRIEENKDYAKAVQVYREVASKYKGTQAAESATKAVEAVKPMVGFDKDCKACAERKTSACPKHKKKV